MLIFLHHVYYLAICTTELAYQEATIIDAYLVVHLPSMEPWPTSASQMPTTQVTAY